MRIVFFGTPEFASYQLRKITKEGYDVIAVVTTPDKPSGRGLKVNISDVKREALELNIPILQPVSLKDPLFLEELHRIDADLFIVVAFRMMPKEVWSIPKYGTFNLHASLLPDYRGAAPINWVIINGESQTGVTTFMIDEKIDTGAILLQESIAIDPRETAGTLHDKLMTIGADLIIKTIAALEKGLVTAHPQPLLREEMKIAPKLTKELGKIEWNRPVTEIDRLIRGLSPYPSAHSQMQNGDKTIDIKIFAAHPELSDHSCEAKIGDISSDGKNFIKIKCSDGYISLEEIQVAGKRKMGIKEFLAGFRNIEEWRFIQ